MIDVRAGEVWKNVPDCKGYQVSSRGRVLGKSGRILRRGDRAGYPSVTVALPSGNRSHLVHLMVLEAFVGPRPDGCEACHINGNRRDARPENLRWASQLQNMRDRDAHGTTARYERHGLAKLTRDAVDEAKSLHAAGASVRTLARHYGVGKSSMHQALTGATWG